ncbi:S-methyl-5-thioribose-1-phosphate isomerase [Bosea sp. (in: a-proteobacteria)]|uniref:S-methyl-5-thioribose-1-phosphate isomerase n=1 Tax=Bosea sp. (in: a-proteobacteria) TaxID=1871050 RepID=UPI001212D012|nr:S-methyl-5-thioribose-1-phosphate isomerase [Bosea sp. (in: a-proteobacteria)]TAJ31287.1 MAG: S-methyl-5-thioribose-1-phosphate isomerase [Bosea sp. (in: a-proteobacteria)]
MKINGQHYRTIWLAQDGWRVVVIDQTRLPFRFETVALGSDEQAADAIRNMVVRGAPLIGATAAYGVALAMRADASDAALEAALVLMGGTRPTAVNLHWALARMRRVLLPAAAVDRAALAYAEAAAICDEDAALCSAIGEHGLPLIRNIAARKPAGEPVNILTHCNAGWLATVDWGTALAPIYRAHDAGLLVHAWVDETRPRNQGGALTAYELGAHGVPHTVVVDNAGGHLMQRGQVDMVIVGTDRTTANGDVANKIGTYLKALAARDNDVPFYVALPSPTIDWTMDDGLRQIPIEERAAREVTHVQGLAEDGEVRAVRVMAPGSAAANPAFDVTPARLVSGLITERGVCAASSEGLAGLFPDLARGQPA